MERGVETKNQRATRPSIVPKGTAPEDWALIKKKLRAKNVPKMTLLFPKRYETDVRLTAFKQ